MRTIVTTGLLLAVLAAPASLAGIALTTEGASTRTCKLHATDAGFAVAAEGIGRLAESARGESMVVKVDAKVKDKTMLIVGVTTKDGVSFDVGMVEMMLGGGLFRMSSTQIGPWKLFPIADIAAISVREKDIVLLEGQCEAAPAN